MFEIVDELSSFRADVRAFFSAHVTADMRARCRSTGTFHDDDLYRELGLRNWIALTWPTEIGGLGLGPLEALVFAEEAHRAGAPVTILGTTLMVGNTIRAAGSATQLADILPRIVAGTLTAALGYTEPESGSDVAAARTSAVRDGENWIINGQKVFTTLAHVASHVFLLCRTKTGSKYRGLTLFLVPMNTPGIDVEPIYTLGGERTNSTYYRDVVVPDSCRIGGVDEGWSVMKAALAYERGGSMGGAVELNAVADHATAWARGQTSLSGSQESLLAELLVDAEVGRLLDLRVRSMVMNDELPVVEGSMQKLFVSESLVRSSARLLDLLGPLGVLAADGDEDDPRGYAEQLYRHAVVTTIAGGTSEIQRSIIAENGMNLPRSRGQ